MAKNKMKDLFLIKELDTLKALSHDMRLALMRLFRTPQTVKQVAATMDLPPTKLYYHVNLLEAHGLLRVTETNVVSGIVEKTYQVVAKHFHIDEALLSDPEQMDEVTTAVLETLITATRRQWQDNRLLMKKGARLVPNHVLTTQVHLTEAEAKAFGERLQALVQEIDAFNMPRDGVETAVFNLTTLFLQTGEET